MGAVMSCFGSLFHAIGGCLSAIVTGIGGALSAILGGIITALEWIIYIITFQWLCNGRRPKGRRGGRSAV